VQKQRRDLFIIWSLKQSDVKSVSRGGQLNVGDVLDVISYRNDLSTLLVGDRNIGYKPLNERCLPHFFFGRKGIPDLSVAFKQCVHN
jgi:hypothetical protein